MLNFFDDAIKTNRLVNVGFHGFPEVMQLALYNYLTCYSYLDTGTIWISGQNNLATFRTKLERKRLYFTVTDSEKEIEVASSGLDSIQTLQHNLVIPKEFFIVPRALTGRNVDFLQKYDLTKPTFLETTSECVLVSYRSFKRNGTTMSFVVNRMFGCIFQITLQNEGVVIARLSIPQSQLGLKKGGKPLILTAPSLTDEPFA